MFSLKVACGALNQTPLDWDGNKQRIVNVVREAKEQQIALLCLPELCISGYGCEDAFLSANTISTSWEVLTELKDETVGMVVSVGLPLLFQKAVYNVSALLINGNIFALLPKQHLAGDGLHYEPRWFKPWPSGLITEYDSLGCKIPLGDMVVDIDGVRLGFEICEDAWVADRPGRRLAALGTDIILNPSASHFAFGKHFVRQRFVIEASRAFGVCYLYSNLLGCEAGRAIYDGDCIIANEGRIIAFGPRFSYRDSFITSSIVDIDLSRMQRAANFQAAPPRDAAEAILRCPDFQLPRAASARDISSVQSSGWERGEELKCEEFARAVALGLFDYLRKSGSKGYVVSLSGGADSTSVCVLAALMVKFACRELGVENFLARLDYISEISDCRDEANLTAKLLTCVYQRTRNNSEITRSAARKVAEAIGAEFHELELDAMVDAYLVLVQQALGRELSWDADNIALQNIQARARVPAVWCLANVKGALLLTTSNRSEAAVGYATMDGDTSGGLNPIGGIDKAFLRHWLSWMERCGVQGFGPCPFLHHVTTQQPTAELKPLIYKQTDEQDLMPYTVLDVIERLAVRDKLSPAALLSSIIKYFEGEYGAADLQKWVERFFTLWARNQWKRERYAPSFHVDDESLDPKTWCRFPILSGGYKRELRRLKEGCDS